MSATPVQLSQRSSQTGDAPISYFMQQAVENPDLISLAAGLVDPVSLPASDIEAAIADILARKDTAQAALQYGTTPGHTPLRELLLRRTCAMDGVAPTDLSLTTSNLVLTTGSQQLLYLLSEVLLDPGDIVITEAPSYFVYHGVLKSMGARVLSVPLDEEGMRTDLLEELLLRLEHTGELARVKMIYTIDYFQNPSGLTLSLPRRRHLMELVRRFSGKHRIIVLEDAAYRELRFEGDDIPSLKSLDEDNEYVVLAMTFSKPCSPGLKTGYGLLPSDLVGPLERFKGIHDFGSANLAQHVLYRLLQCGAFERHVAELRKVYRRKCEATRAALTEAFGTDGHDRAGIHWTHPTGGMYVWLSYPEGTDTGPHGKLMKAALHEGVLYVPGQFCYVHEKGEPAPGHEIRVCFGVAEPKDLREGIFRLARATRKVHPELMPSGSLAGV